MEMNKIELEFRQKLLNGLRWPLGRKVILDYNVRSGKSHDFFQSRAVRRNKLAFFPARYNNLALGTEWMQIFINRKDRKIILYYKIIVLINHCLTRNIIFHLPSC